LSDPWWKRRKKKDPWFDDIYEELERLGDMIDETMQKAFENSEDTPKRNRIKGFSIKIGSDGKPKIKKFTDRQLVQDETEIDDEPLVDVFEEEQVLVILASLPGVKKDEIDLRVTEWCLTVSVNSDNLEWYEELELPTKVKPKYARASFKNGVLEIKLEKSGKLIKN
jgi:HSP20 family protein